MLPLLSTLFHATSVASAPVNQGVWNNPWNKAWTKTPLQGSTWKMTLEVGRLPGLDTRMPKEWAASGARLSVPMEITFSDEPVQGSNPEGDLRWLVEEPACCPARRLLATPGSFVGAQGEVEVACSAGGWLAEPADRCGMSVLRWYLDFPTGAQRNDAILPAGRVFFRSACWDGDELSKFQSEAETVQAELDACMNAAAAADNLVQRAQAMSSQSAETLRYHQEILERSLPDQRGVLPGPGGVQLAAGGELSIKVNGARQLWGALGNRYHTIGRFSLKEVDDREEDA